ncbi:multiple antibiotic resistance protein [Amorphus suaedae]
MTNYLLNALTTLFVTVDPIGLAPIFLALTPGWSRAARRVVAIKASAVAFGILLAFALVGNSLLGFLGISLSAFRVAGGLLLFWIAAEMVFGKRTERKATLAQEATREEAADSEGGGDHAAGSGAAASAAEDEHADIAAFPLAIPLIAGPGAISAVILLADHAPSNAAFGAMIATIALVLASTLVVFLAAPTVDRFLGATGRAVLTRLLGVILAALAVQFVADGIITLAKTV